MNKYISDYIKNKLRFLEKSYDHKTTKIIENCVRKIFHTGRLKVKHIGNNTQNTKRSAGQKLSRLLGKEDLMEKIEGFSLKNIQGKIDTNTVIAYDLTDIAKPFSKKMEKISKIFDGSKRKSENGYFVHGLGIEGGLLSLRVADQNAKFLPTERREILEKYLKKLDYKGIWTFDRGNDDQKLFRLLSEKNTKFIVRLKRNRKVKIKIYEKKTKKFSWSEWMNLDDLPENSYDVQISSKEEYRLIIHKHLADKKSIKLITNLDKTSFYPVKVVELYLGRWCIEKQFKSMKTKFSLEEIQVRKFRAIQNLVSLVHLSINLSQIFWRNLEENLSVIWRSIFHEFKKFCIKESLNLSFDSATFYLKSMILDPFSSVLIIKKPDKIQDLLPQLHFDCDF